MPSMVPKSPRASTGAVTRHSPPDFATATVDVPCAISTRSTFSRSKFITFLSRRSNGALLNVDSRYPAIRKTFLSLATFAYRSLPVAVFDPICSVRKSLSPFCLKLTSATGSFSPKSPRFAGASSTTRSAVTDARLLVTDVISESSPRAGAGLVSFQPSAVFCSSATPPAIVEIFSWSILSASTPAKTFGLSGVASSSGFFASTK